MSLARQFDLCTGTCTSHSPSPIPMTGYILGGSMDVSGNGLGAAKVTDIVIGYCGHIGIIIQGSSTVMINSLGAAKIGSTFSGAYTGIVIQGSTDIIVGN